MRCYLSSFRIGNQAARLQKLVGENVETAVIANAVDADPTPVRQAKVEGELEALSALDLRPEELDLRAFFDRPDATEAALVYGGYSAGPCVLGPTIRGFSATDDPTVVTEVYGAAPMWAGLGIVDFVVVPHVDSPGHPESERLSDLAATFHASGVRHRSLCDGQVLIIDGDHVAVG